MTARTTLDSSGMVLGTAPAMRLLGLSTTRFRFGGTNHGLPLIGGSTLSHREPISHCSLCKSWRRCGSNKSPDQRAAATQRLEHRQSSITALAVDGCCIQGYGIEKRRRMKPGPRDFPLRCLVRSKMDAGTIAAETNTGRNCSRGNTYLEYES
eukprot:scaffold144465_cov30-Tisochrysis_lutea.AAC.2